MVTQISPAGSGGPLRATLYKKNRDEPSARIRTHSSALGTY